jgi:hypothetical protein
LGSCRRLGSLFSARCEPRDSAGLVKMGRKQLI